MIKVVFIKQKIRPTLRGKEILH